MLLLLFERGNSNDDPGYLPAVLCLWSEARPWELPLAAIIGDVVPLSSPNVDVMKL